MGNLSSSIVWMLGGMALASTVLLSACDSATTSASNSTNVAKPVAPAELPPAIEKSVTYRCQDNGIVSVDFLNDGLTATLRTDGNLAQLKANETGGPFHGGGVTMTVDSSGSTRTDAGRQNRKKNGGAEWRRGGGKK